MGTPTINALAGVYSVDIATVASPNTWLHLYGMNDCNPSFDATTQDNSDMDGGGYGSDVKTMLRIKLSIKANRKTDTAGVPDPAFVALENARESLGANGNVYVRYARMDGIGKGHQFLASVVMDPSKTGVPDLDEWSITLSSQGAPSDYAYTAPGWQATTIYGTGATVKNGAQILRATVGGTSGATAPSTSTAVGSTVSDGSVTWLRLS